MRSGSSFAAAAAVAVSVGLVCAGCGAGEIERCGAVEYPAGGSPELVVVADLPYTGASRGKAEQIRAAIRLELDARGFRAGTYTVGLQACDDSSHETGRWEPWTCSGNANEYAEREEVIGVVGPLDSGCAAAMIPILNRAEDGSIPLVSPTATAPCLTRAGPGCDLTEPDRYYPTGTRSFLRVVGTDRHQAAALAELARFAGARRLFLLDDGEAYGRGIVTSVGQAAEALGLEVVGRASWDPEAPSYVPLFERVRARRPDAVILAGLIEQNGARVIAAKREVLGPNDGPVALLASDGFASASLLQNAGDAARRMYVTTMGVPLHRFPAAGAAFARRLAASLPDATLVDPDALFGAQAARVLLDAIAASDGTRGDVRSRLFRVRVRSGLIGSFSFDRNGDPAHADGPSVGVSVSRVTDRLVFERTIEPSREALAAVR